MAAKLTQTQLKKQLNDCSKEELVYLITRLYKFCPDANSLRNAEMGDDSYIDGLLEEAKVKIRKEFFPARGFGRPSLSSAKSVIASFKQVCSDTAKVIDLQLYYVENGVEFTDAYGDINESFYNSMGSMFRAVVDAMNKTDDPAIYEQFKDRLKAVVEDTAGMGWGFNEDLSDSYYSLKWIES